MIQEYRKEEMHLEGMNKNFRKKKEKSDAVMHSMSRG